MAGAADATASPRCLPALAARASSYQRGDSFESAYLKLPKVVVVVSAGPGHGFKIA